LLRFLQRQQTISAADAVRLEEVAQQEDISIHEVLEREGIITERDLAVLLANSLRLKLLDLASFPVDTSIARILKENVATKYEVLPIRLEDNLVEVATPNPLDLEALKAVEFNTGRRVLASVATRIEVRDALAHAYRLQESLEDFLQGVPDEEPLAATQLFDDGSDLRSIANDAELPPVVKLADLILVEGIKAHASDVHVEPANEAVVVRYRIDGILEDAFRFPKWVQNALTGRFKIMARLDITERRQPQDGRIQVFYHDRQIDLRVSSLPTRHGEKMTLRILDANRSADSLDRLGFNPTDLQRMRDAGHRPQGMILVTGPTGSGKTTSLHALLKEIFDPSINIITIENPVEYQLKGINQVDINGKQGLTFASVLRSVLRQDPDVILVGEIRDQETAHIACQAAQTGHLVLSTVHTNDPAATVTRLLDLGVEPYTLASSLLLIVAQRLVRRVCPECAEPYTPSAENIRRLHLEGRTGFRRGRGCNACRQSGFAGRLAVGEVVPITPTLAKMIEAGMGESGFRHQARREGIGTLLEDALEKMTSGQTTDEEVLRVVQVDDNAARCPACQKEVDNDFTVCPHCATVLHSRCTGCGKGLSPEWNTCPYCGAAVQAKPAQAPRPSGPADLPPVAPPAPEQRSFKALVVDDQPDLRRIVRMALEKSDLGLTVVTAQDGIEALTLAAVERPDVVILDVSMPGMDGFEVCARLRADVATAFVPVLMLTAHDSVEYVTRGFGVGADDYLVKPFRRDDLVARVRRMLERTYGTESVKRAASATADKPAAGAEGAAQGDKDGYLH
jgi:type IV pilus assembly protein PilB